MGSCIKIYYIFLIYLDQSLKILVFSIEGSSVDMNVTQVAPFDFLSGCDTVVCCDIRYTNLNPGFTVL